MGTDLTAAGVLVAIFGGVGALLFEVKRVLHKGNDRVLGFHPGERFRATMRKGREIDPVTVQNRALRWIVRHDNKTTLEKWGLMRNFSLVLVPVGVLVAVLGVVLYNL